MTGLLRASARSGDIVGGGPTVTFGGAGGLYPVGDGAAAGLGLGHGSIPPLLGTALGALSVKFGVKFTEK